MDRDDTLVELFKNGDEKAFNELFGLYRDSIFGYLCRMLRDRQSAEDLAQEVFISVYTNAANYRPEGHFKAWIYRIASNLAKNEFKKRSYRVMVSLFSPIQSGDNDLTLADTIAGPGETSGVIMERKEKEKLVKEVINELPLKYREVLVLCAIEELSYEEAARALNTNVKTVSSRLARARAVVMKKMKALEG